MTIYPGSQNAAGVRGGNLDCSSMAVHIFLRIKEVEHLILIAEECLTLFLKAPPLPAFAHALIFHEVVPVFYAVNE